MTSSSATGSAARRTGRRCSGRAGRSRGEPGARVRDLGLGRVPRSAGAQTSASRPASTSARLLRDHDLRTGSPRSRRRSSGDLDVVFDLHARALGRGRDRVPARARALISPRLRARRARPRLAPTLDRGVEWAAGRGLVRISVRRRGLVVPDGPRSRLRTISRSGWVLTVHAVREAVNDGMRAYRFLLGEEQYKARFATADHGLDSFVIPRTARGRAGHFAQRVRGRLARWASVGRG